MLVTTNYQPAEAKTEPSSMFTAGSWILNWQPVPPSLSPIPLPQMELFPHWRSLTMSTTMKIRRPTIAAAILTSKSSFSSPLYTKDLEIVTKTHTC